MASRQRKITMDEATTAVGELVFHLQQNLESSTGITVSEVVKAGSLGHGTAVPGNFDLDLVLYSRDIDADRVARTGYREWLVKVERFLVQTLGGQVEKTIHSVQFKYKGIEVDLLVSPYWEKPSDLYHFLGSLPADPPNERFHFSVNASKWQVAFFQKQPSQLKEFVKRAKAWRNEKWLKSEGGEGKPSSYLISLLVLRAYEKACTKVGYGAITHVIASETTVQMRDLVNNHGVLDICWESDKNGGYYTRRDCRHLLPARPRIIDPANPTNNLYKTGVRHYRPNERVSDYELGDGNWTLFKMYIGTLDLTKTVEEIML